MPRRFSDISRAVALATTFVAIACTPAGPPRTDPLPLSAALSMRLSPAARTLDSAIAAGAAPGAVLAVSIRGERFVHSVGQLAIDDPRPPDGRTIYDMASLTKLIATTTLAMMAVDEGKLEIDFSGTRNCRPKVHTEMRTE